ncbi:MAG: methyltransferase family protein [Candidatus Binataceae bacterium]
MLALKLIAGVVSNVVLFGIMLFLPAGTFDWGRAWIFLGVVFIATSATMFGIFRGNEALLDERYSLPIQEGQPVADRIVLVLFIVTFAGAIVFIPLDVFRFHLLAKPGVIVSTLGLILFCAGWLLISLAFRENTFAAPVVKHQAERRQTVIDSGVYSVVRHPMYSSAVLMLIGISLWLESYAAALFSVIPIALLAVRIIFEERFLRRALDGYDAYVERVRYRLIPFLW